MNIREYIENPIGKGDSSITNRREFINSLNVKYANLIRKKGDKIKLNIYENKRNDEFYFHLIIPSETDRENSYDVVFHFYDPSKKYYDDLSISNYEINVFSNSPSFAYTFAYVYTSNGLMIDELSSKLGKVFVKKSPEVRNRFGIINYEKYIYFGAKYILDSKRMNRNLLNMVSKPFNMTSLKHTIRSLSEIMNEYDNAKAILKRRQITHQPSRNLGKSNVVIPKNISGKTISKKQPKSPVSKKHNVIKMLKKR